MIQRRLRFREIALSSTTMTLATGFLGQLFLVASGVFAARILGAHDRGYLALLVLVPAALAQLGPLGLPVATTYYVAQRPENARAIVARLIPVCVAQAALLTLLHAGLLVLMRHFVALPLVPALISLGFIPASLAQAYGLSVLQGRQAFKRFNILRLLPVASYAVGLTALAVAGGGGLTTVTAIWVGAGLLAGIATLFAVPRVLPPDREGSANLREMFRFGARALIDATSPVDAFRADQAVVGLFLSPTALGLYVVALAFTNLPRFIGQSIGLVAYPRIAAARAQVGREMRKYVALVIAIAGAAVLLLEALMSRIVPLFFGSEFTGAVPLARIMLVASFFVAVRRVLADCLRGAGRPGAGTIAEISSWIVLFPLLAPFAAVWGVRGVAFALLTAAAVSLVVIVGLACLPAGSLRRYGVRASVGFVALSCLAGAALAFLPARDSGLVVAAVAILAISAAVILATSPRTLATVFMVLGAATLAMTGVRITNWMAVSDAFFAAAAIIVLPWAVVRLGQPSAVRRTMSTGLLLIVIGGLLSSFVAEDWRTSNVHFVKLLVASVLILALTSAWAPTIVELRLVTLAFIASATASALWALKNPSADFGRPPGLALHPNALGLTSVLALGPLLLLTGESRSWQRRAGILTALVLFAGILVSGSRAGAVGAAVVLFLALLVSGWRLVAGLAIGGAVLAALVFGAAHPKLPPQNAVTRLLDRGSASVAVSDAARRSALNEAVSTISRHPVTGVGFASAGAAHDVYLEAWESGGVLALLGFLVVAWATLTPLRAAASAASEEYRRHIVILGISIGFAGYLVASLFENAIWERYIWLMPALVAAGWPARQDVLASAETPARRDDARLPHAQLGEVGA